MAISKEQHENDQLAEISRLVSWISTNIGLFPKKLRQDALNCTAQIKWFFHYNVPDGWATEQVITELAKLLKLTHFGRNDDSEKWSDWEARIDSTARFWNKSASIKFIEQVERSTQARKITISEAVPDEIDLAEISGAAERGAW